MTQKPAEGFLIKLAGDFQSTREYLSASRKLKKLSNSAQAANGRINAKFVQIAEQAEKDDAFSQLPKAQPVRQARKTLDEAQTTLQQRKSTATEAEKKLAEKTRSNTELIAKLEAEYAPLQQASAGAEKTLHEAKGKVVSLDAELQKTASSLASLGKESANDSSEQELRQKLSEVEKQRGDAATFLNRRMEEHKSAHKAAGQKSADLRSAKKIWQNIEAKCRAEISAAQSPTGGAQQAIKLAQEKLVEEERKNLQIIQTLESDEKKLNESATALAAQVEADRKRLAELDAQTLVQRQKLAFVQLTQKKEKLTGDLSQAKGVQAEAESKNQSAASAAREKQSQINQAKKNWEQEKSACDAQVAGAKAAMSQAESAVTVARKPLNDAMLAFGKSVFESGKTTPSIEQSLAEAKLIAAELSQIEEQTAQTKRIRDMAKPAARRFAAKTTLVLILIIAIIVAAWMLLAKNNSTTSPEHSTTQANLPAIPAASAPTTTKAAKTTMPASTPTTASTTKPVFDNRPPTSSPIQTRIDMPPVASEIPDGKLSPSPGWKFKVTRQYEVNGIIKYDSGQETVQHNRREVDFIEEFKKVRDAKPTEVTRQIVAAQAIEYDPVTMSDNRFELDECKPGTIFMVDYATDAKPRLFKKNIEISPKDDVIEALGSPLIRKLWPGGELKVDQQWSFTPAQIDQIFKTLGLTGGKLDLRVENIGRDRQTKMMIAKIRGPFKTQIIYENGKLMDFDATLELDLATNLNVPLSMKISGAFSYKGSVKDENKNDIGFTFTGQTVITQTASPVKNTIR